MQYKVIMIRRRALASKVWVRIFNVDSEGISVLVGFSTVRAEDLWQDDMLGLNMSHHVESVEAGVATDVADKPLASRVPTVVGFTERF